MSRRAVGWALVVAVVAAPTAAVAQHHHHHHHEEGGDAEPAERAPAIQGHVGITVEGGQVDAFAGDRSYQGASLMVGARRDRYEAMVHVPIYRITLGAASHVGLGDMHLMAGYVAVVREHYEAGVSAGVMPPLGDDTNGLAMGHWMVMAGGFARAHRGRLGGDLHVGYGGAPAGGGHAEHGVPAWPPVNPMNGHELRATANLNIAVAGDMGVATRGVVAVPLGTGDVLGFVGAGATYQLGRYTVGAGAGHGLAGHTAALVVTANVMSGF